MAKVDFDKMEDILFDELQEPLLSLNLTREQYGDLINELIGVVKKHLESRYFVTPDVDD